MKIKKAAHVALIVSDMDRSIDYYNGLFGFKVRKRGKSPTREITFLYNESQPGFEIELIRDLVPGDSYAERGIVNHLAFAVDNIEEAITYYEERGVLFHSNKPNVAIDGAKTVFFYGPNKELLQLVESVQEIKGMEP